MGYNRQEYTKTLFRESGNEKCVLSLEMQVQTGKGVGGETGTPNLSCLSAGTVGNGKVESRTGKSHKI